MGGNANSDAWVTTISGRIFHLDQIDPEEISIGDVAHGLANTCRWGGHVEEFYSVAQHSVIMSRVATAKFALVALMHDASEAYIGDIVRPLKRLLPQYTELEEKVMFALSVKFGFEWPMPDEIKALDNAMIAWEHKNLRGQQDPTVWDPKLSEEFKIPQHAPWSPEFSRKQFLKRFAELAEARRQVDMFEELERGRLEAMRRSTVELFGNDPNRNPFTGIKQ